MVARCPQRVHSSMWPPSAAVRQRAIATRTLIWVQRVHWRLRSMKAVPAVRDRSATSRGGLLASPTRQRPPRERLRSHGLYGSNLVLLWWRELNPRSWSEPNASPGLILLKNTHQRPWIMAFPSLPVSSEEQIRPRNCVLRLIVSCPTRQNHPPAYAGIHPMYCERSNTSRDYCANETVQDRVWNCGSDAENVRDVSNTIAVARGG